MHLHRYQRRSTEGRESTYARRSVERAAWLVLGVTVCAVAACTADSGDPLKAIGSGAPGGSSTNVVTTSVSTPSTNASSYPTMTGTAAQTSTSRQGTTSVGSSTPLGTSTSSSPSSTSSSPSLSSASSSQDAAPPPGDGGAFDLCSCNPTKCNDCTSAIATCNSTAGCNALMQCVSTASCGGYPNACTPCTGSASQAAINAGNSVAGCMGGCQ